MRKSTYNKLVKIIGDKYEIFSSRSRNFISAGPHRFKEVAFKPQFDFLKNGLGDSIYFRDDIFSNSRLYYRNGQFFVTRAMDPDLIIQKEMYSVNNLSTLNLEHCSFEEIMGYFINDTQGGDDLLVHQFSGGLELFSVSSKTLVNWRSSITTVAAKAFSDIHKNGVIYTDPTPINMRWDYADRVIFNPHPFIEFLDKEKNEDGEINDLSIFLMTNPWISDKKEFLSKYMGHNKEGEMQGNALLGAVSQRIRQLENDPDIPADLYAFWRSR